MIKYGFIKELSLPFETAVERTVEAMKQEGFGVLTRIDIKEKLKEKLGVEFKKYVILGACNPPLAYEALQKEENIGLLLPCNVVVYEKGDKTVVGIIKPSEAMRAVENEELRRVAMEAEAKLKRVFEAIK